MAELVNQNMEQMLPFLDELEKHIDKKKIKEIVQKRHHHEYKIVPKFRKFEEFSSYIEDEMKNLKYISSLKLAEAKSLNIEEKKLIKRIIKQVTVHFQSDPKAFLLSVRVLSSMKNTSLEKYYWLTLLQKHGYRDIKFYLTAAHRAMTSMKLTEINTAESKIERKRRYLDNDLDEARCNKNYKKSKEIKLEIKKLELEKENVQVESTNKLIKWTRDIYFSAIKEFPQNKDLFKAYLKFELNNYLDQTNSSIENVDELGICKDGRVIEVILQQILNFPLDLEYLNDIIRLITEFVPTLQLESFVKMKELQSSVYVESTSLVTDSKMEVICVIDHYNDFLLKYPQPKVIRAIAPNKAKGDLVSYLQSLKSKLLNGELNKDVEMPKVRDLLDWILSDDDWSGVCLDVWWEYILLEKCCGKILNCFKIFQDADFKLKQEYKAYLTVRKLKEDLFK